MWATRTIIAVMLVSCPFKEPTKVTAETTTIAPTTLGETFLTTPPDQEGPCDTDRAGCVDGQKYEDKKDCTVYYLCSNGNFSQAQKCIAGTDECQSEPCYFDTSLKKCRYKSVEGFGLCLVRCSKSLLPSANTSASPAHKVKFQSHSPTYGPVDGGTRVVITGTFINIDTLDLSLAPAVDNIYVNSSHSANTTFWNATHVVMVTNQVPGYYSGTKYYIHAQYLDRQGDRYTFLTNMMFVYRPNPAISDIYPRRSFISGGIKITAIGKNLDSVFSPVMTVTVEKRIYQGNQDVYTVEETKRYESDNTTVYNTTSIIGTTPKIPTSALNDQSTSDGPITGEQTVAFLGFDLDGSKKYQNLSKTLGDKGKLQLVIDPKVTGFENDVLMYNPNVQTNIEIKGKKFTLGATISDYLVTVGNDSCRVQHPLLDNVVSCVPPKQEPLAVNIAGKEYKPGQPFVMMSVGNAKFYIGYIDYVENPSILLYILPSIAGLAIVVVIILAIYCCCCNRKQSSKHNDDVEIVESSWNTDVNTLTPSSRYQNHGRDEYLAPVGTQNDRMDGYLAPVGTQNDRIDGYLAPVGHNSNINNQNLIPMGFQSDEKDGYFNSTGYQSDVTKGYLTPMRS